MPERAPMRLIPCLLLALALAGCAPRTQVDFAEPAPGAQLQTVYVAHTRGPDPAQPVPGWERSEALGFGRYVVAIPPGHTTGRIDRPRRNQAADPAVHFTVASQQPMDRATFRQAIARGLADETRAQREVTIFVHGFNTAFIEGVYRVAQLGQDLQLPGILAHYSWPSLGAPLAYAHDRDSALFARDGLQAMIEEAAAAGAPRIVLIAHSMGSHLVMETLRQMALDGSLRRIPLGGVILISPDVDVDVFIAQARRIGRLPQPFLIIASQRDRVLQLSARLTGQPGRLGNITDSARVIETGATVLDITAFGAGDGHFTVAESPALIQLLGRIGAVDAALAADASAALPLIPGTILTLQTTTEFLLQPGADPRTRRPVLPFLPVRRAQAGQAAPVPEQP
jgi:esterase/lipase superfamily enzyme